jgi:hypothetical protein
MRAWLDKTGRGTGSLYAVVRLNDAIATCRVCPDPHPAPLPLDVDQAKPVGATPN